MIDIDLIKKLRDVATTKIQHLYQGCCPDSLDGFDERDTEEDFEYYEGKDDKEE